jgi:hypothetical protein
MGGNAARFIDCQNVVAVYSVPSGTVPLPQKDLAGVYGVL